jgi:hypothetical protein
MKLEKKEVKDHNWHFLEERSRFLERSIRSTIDIRRK